MIRRIFTPMRLAFLGILTLLFFSVFAFFYSKYARMIDARFRGDVIVRTTGIYAAPRTIRVSQGMTLVSLKSYLDGIGYVESTKEADSNRGRYLINGNIIKKTIGAGPAIVQFCFLLPHFSKPVSS
ncbi:MAG: hypothetical protein AABN33_22965 [Acidobacteriota bacterium]